MVKYCQGILTLLDQEAWREGSPALNHVRKVDLEEADSLHVSMFTEGFIH